MYNILILGLLIWLCYITVTKNKQSKLNEQFDPDMPYIESDKVYINENYQYSSRDKTGFNDNYIKDNEYIGDALNRYDNENNYPVALDEGDVDGIYEDLYELDQPMDGFATY